jgi:site-specific DNA-methyltransferase (adenine-specific)
LSQLAWAHAHETLLWASKSKGSRHTFNYDLLNGPDSTSQVSSVWRIPAVPTSEKSHGRHPTQKPLRLLRRAVLTSTGEGELVFDPFCASGTTGVAAKELGRFFVGRRPSGGTRSWRLAGSGPRCAAKCCESFSPRKRVDSPAG